MSITTARQYSSDTLGRLRTILATDVDASHSTVVVGGSYARLEASPASDLDYYFFAEDQAELGQAVQLVKSKLGEIQQVVPRAPSSDGAFGSDGVETISNLLSNVGGNDDSNQKITRRILFLLEGTWLTNEACFNLYRRRLIERYVSDSITSKKICRFLLNDIIRYYRTICVDFEYKTSEKGKAWGIRLVKLWFPRKLIYVGGIIAVAETYGLTRDEKVARLDQLFQQSPIERIYETCKTNSAPVIACYDQFLHQISGTETRAELSKVSPDKATHTETFRNLKELGKKFNDELDKMLRATYEPSHPIHKAILF